MDPVTIGTVVGVAIYSVFEYWIGNTKKVEANSAIALILSGVKSVVKDKTK